MATRVEMREAAPESVSCCRAIVESCPDPVWVFDRKGRLEWRNRPAAQADCDVASDGTRLLELVSHEALALARRVCDEASRGIASRATMRLRFGQTASVTTTPICEGDQTVGFVCVARDVTLELRHLSELRRRERELHVFRDLALATGRSTDLPTLLEHSLDAVLRVTGLHPAGGIFMVDERLGELRLIAHRGLPARFVQAEERVLIDECVCGLAARTGQVMLSNDGSHPQLLVPLSTGVRVRGVMFVYPCPEYVLDEEARELFSAVGQQLGLAMEHVLARRLCRSELKRRIAELEARLQSAAREQQDGAELEKAAGDFVAMVSHDLRTPLTGILAHAELLSRRAKRHGVSWCSDSSEAIVRIGRHMDAMISDLTDSARLASCRIDLDKETVPPDALVTQVLEMLPTGERQRVLVDAAPELPPLRVDRERIARALMNVVCNALKYSPAERPVHVEVSAANEGVTFAVEDHGVGIGPDKLPHVFERFYRAGETTGPAGLGLGLYIARLLVRAHGGEISATSVPGVQSTFRIVIPVDGTASALAW